MANETNRLLSATEPARDEARQTEKPTITLLMPVLNEINGLKATLPFIDRTLVTEILVVDGGSTDGSAEYAECQAVTVVRQRRPGLAWAVYDAIVQLDTD